MKMHLIEEIVGYITKNNGPDENGRGHPGMKRLQCGDLEIAIAAAEARGLAQGLKPYHFNSTVGVWKNEEYRNEAVVKKIDQLLMEKYDNDLVKLITNTDKKELTSPFLDEYNGRGIKVKTNSLAIAYFSNSPFEIVSRYIELKGLQKQYWNIRPYHFAKTKRDTYNDEKNVNEVLVKKIDQVLEQNYRGDLAKLTMEADQPELSAPFIDKLNSRDVEVSMFHIIFQFKSIYRVMKKYHEIKHLAFEFTEESFSSKRKRIAGLKARGTYQPT